MKRTKIKIGDVCKIKHGFAFKGEYFKSSGKHLVLTPGNFVEGGGFKLRPGKDRFYAGEYPAEYLLKKGDVLLAMTEQSYGLLGSPIEIPEDDRYLHNQRLGLVCDIDCDRIDPHFLALIFRTREFQLYLRSTSTGSTVRHTSPSKIEEYEVHIPTEKSYQEFSGQLIRQIEASLTVANEQNKCLEDIALSIFNRWFVDFEFPDESGNPYKSFGGRMLENERREIPEGWEERSIYSIAQFTNGASFKPSDLNDEGRGLPVIKIAELKNGITPLTKYSDTEMVKEVIVKPEDILFSWSGSPDTSIDIFIWSERVGRLNQHTFRVDSPQKEDRSWVYFQLKSLKSLFIRCATHKQTTGLGHVTVSDLKENMIPIPDQRVRKLLREFSDPIFEKIYLNKLHIRNLEKVRDLLLPRLMAGEIGIEPSSL